MSTIALVACIPACGGRPPAAVPGKPDTLLIAAAADLAAVQKPLIDAFAAVGGMRAEVVLGSSGILARQIEQGAPYDVYLSANQDYVDRLAAAGKLLPDTVRVYAGGRLGLWSRSGTIRELEDLAAASITHVALANPAHAPYGAAARQALENAGIWPRVESKIVYGENVRQALQFAESGNAEAVLTAWSLVHDRGGILVPDSLHAPVLQSGGAVAGSPKAFAARRFMDFLMGPDGQRVLRSGGFFTPR